MEDRHLARLLRTVVVQRGAGLAQEQGQRRPVFEQVADGLAEAGVGLDVLAVDFRVALASVREAKKSSRSAVASTKSPVVHLGGRERARKYG